MYQGNRNLFSILAVLTAAGVIVGIFGIAFLAIDKMEGKPYSRLSSTGQDADQDPALSFDLGLKGTDATLTNATLTDATLADDPLTARTEKNAPAQ